MIEDINEKHTGNIMLNFERIKVFAKSGARVNYPLPPLLFNLVLKVQPEQFSKKMK